jgi:alpha-L-fucosidase
MIDIVSKNGNLLLNVSPKSDGTITPEQTNVLLEVGKWFNINGEGIYGTRPWDISGEGPTENPAEDVQFNEYSNKGYTAADIRFTSRGDVVYAFCLDLPDEKRITIKSLGLKNNPTKRVKKIDLLGSSEKLTWRQKGDALVINTPSALPCEHAIAFKIML